MVQVMVWQQRLRRCPDRPCGRQRRQFDALLALAELLDWPTGEGFASTPDIAKGADVGERTVRRAIRWAQDNGWLHQTTRGHGHMAGADYAKATASEWLLLLPEQPANSSPATTGNGEQPANWTEQPANPSEQPANPMGRPPESTPPESSPPESKSHDHSAALRGRGPRTADFQPTTTKAPCEPTPGFRAVAADIRARRRTEPKQQQREERLAE